MEEFAHFITHAEHYFLNTTKEFIIRPGKNSMDYLKGKRKHYQKPVSFFLIWAGLYILLHNFVINTFHYKISGSAVFLFSDQENANELLRNHFTLFFIPALFVASILIYFILGKPRFYYPEVLALSLYGAGCFNAMLLVSDIVLGVLLQININSAAVFIFQTLFSAVYNFWFCFDLFRKIHLRRFWLRLLLTAFFTAMVGWVIFLYLPEIWVNIFN